MSGRWWRERKSKQRFIMTSHDNGSNSNANDQPDAQSNKMVSVDQTYGHKGLSEIDRYLDHNISKLYQLFDKCSDVVFRDVTILSGKKALLIYIDGLVNMDQLDIHLLKPLMMETSNADSDMSSVKDLIETTVNVAQIGEVQSLDDVVAHVLSAESALLVDGESSAITISAKKWDHRSVEEPSTEAVIRGPREGFIENIRTNTALIRRRIRTPNLKMESMKIGRITKTDVVISYIDGLVTDSVVTEIKSRLERIDIDGILESGYIEELIEDNPFSPFPQIQNTERPDVVAANLLEGRVAIFVDGTPFVLVAPINLLGMINANEDYYERFLISTAIRVIRYIFVFIALLLPSIYVAITTYHQEMLPTSLLISVASAREAVPFPAIVEAFIMEVTFEALREAGVRLPRPVGSAVSIVGALVIGQAAVEAGIVSAPMVIVVSITGIASFTIPRYNFGISIRLLRFPIIILAGTLGLFGVVIGLLAILIHVCSLRSIGVPYTSPIAPITFSNLKDTLFRAPHWAMRLRPRVTGYQNPVRTGEDLRPQPDKKSR